MILYGPDGKPVTSIMQAVPTLRAMRSVVEALNRRNRLLRDAPREAQDTGILTADGRPWLRVVK